jgi:hypothetical protein
MKLPKTVHVRVESPPNEEAYLIASADLEGVMDGDGLCTVGVYQLVRTVKAKKVVEVVELARGASRPWARRA